jgi:hypothetical protein
MRPAIAPTYKPGHLFISRRPENPGVNGEIGALPEAAGSRNDFSDGLVAALNLQRVASEI